MSDEAPKKYVVRYFFDWMAGWLWSGSPATREVFEYCDFEEKILSPERRGLELRDWHDTALDWSNPSGPSPWSKEEYTQFLEAAREFYDQMLAEIGDRFEIIYKISVW